MMAAVDFASDAAALLIEGRGHAVSYRELGRRVDAVREQLRRLPRPALMFQFAPNGPGAVAAYLACLVEGIPLGLGEPAVAARDRVIAAYQPTAVLLPAGEASAAGDYEAVGTIPGGDVALWRRRDGAPYEHVPYRDLALLLATSGSTGAAKFVRLSQANLLSNARSIAAYLAIDSGETAVQSLPIHYSYGLSVLNSHLVAQGTVMLTSHSFMRPEFWRAVEESGCTSFAGVPYMYETLHRLRLIPTDRPTVRTLTQAGGHLRVELVRHFGQAAQKRGARFFVMYGQTEATARIAYVPPERLADKLGSIGRPIPGGELWLEPVEGETVHQQLHYRGPNVMLGYATGPEDLVRGDEQMGVLATGDLAEKDADGFFFITGRLARFAKLFGKRIQLADVEAELEKTFGHHAAALDGGDQLNVFMEGASEVTLAAARAHLAGFLGVPPPSLKVRAIERLPLTTSGKKNYQALAGDSPTSAVPR